MEEVRNDMQFAIDLWKGRLKATGGAIVLTKSWTYPITLKFDSKGVWSYKTQEESNVFFTVKDHQNVITPLTTVEVSTDKETLGVILPPDGNQRDAVKVLKHNVTEWRNLIKSEHLKRKNAWQAMETMIFIKNIEVPPSSLKALSQKIVQLLQPLYYQELYLMHPIVKNIFVKYFMGPFFKMRD